MNQHEKAIRMAAHDDADTLQNVRPVAARAFEVHCDRSSDEPANAVEIAIAELGAVEAERIYEAEWDAILGVSRDPKRLQWLPRVSRDADSFRRELLAVCATVSPMPTTDDDRPLPIASYEAITDALEVQIGLTAAALMRAGRPTTTHAIEATREAAHRCAEFLALALGAGIDGDRGVDAMRALITCCKEMHRG